MTKKIKQMATLLLIVAFAAVTASCGKDDPAPKTITVAGVTLDQPTLTLTVGGTQTLTATVLPEDATNKTLTWASSNTAVATVSNGAVTAVSAGATTITVTTEDGAKTATCAVTVNHNIELTVTPDNGNVKFYAVATKLTVDWGDGTTPAVYNNVTEITYSYANSNMYTVKITEQGLTEFGDKVTLTFNGDYYDWNSYQPLTGTIGQLTLNSCPALKRLSLYNNGATGITVNNCPALEYLDCENNVVSSLTLNNCTALNTMFCRGNQLTALDVSGCTALAYLSCNNNLLTTLDVSGYTALVELYCENTQLTTLNISGCTALKGLYCYSNQLTTLNVSSCTALLMLDCDNNQLTTLNVSSCTALQLLLCYNNQLTTLNVSGCTALEYLDCDINQLVSAAINTVFTDLPDRTSTYNGSISVNANPGSTTCTPSIATIKNWAVYNSPSGTSSMKSKMQMPERRQKLRIKN